MTTVPSSTALATSAATIPELLAEARRLQSTLPPLFTWAELCEIISTSRLELLSRHPLLETLYMNEFNPLIRRTFGGVEAYLRMQLGWVEGAEEPAYWSRGDETKVRVNDWGYSVPNDVTHHVVWVPSPLFHPLLCTKPTSLLPLTPPATPTDRTEPEPDLPSTKGSWEHVRQYGLSGLTGLGTTQVENGPEKEIEAFVRSRWNEDEWETAWFANPPALQSVRGLAHFHVLARKKSVETKA